LVDAGLKHLFPALALTVFTLASIPAGLTAFGQAAPRSAGGVTAPKTPSNAGRTSRIVGGHTPRMSRGAGSSRPRGPVSEESQRFLELGDNFSGQSKWTAAEVAYREAIKLSPSNSDALVALGSLYNDEGKHGDAFPQFNRAREIDPSNEWIYYGIGYAYMRGQRYNEAVGFFNQALKFNPEFGEAYFYLGFTFLSMGKKQYAIEQYEKLKKLDAQMAEDLLKEINRK